MRVRRFWQMLAIMMLAMIAVPSNGAAAASEKGATVAATGERTVTVRGEQVGASMQREAVIVSGSGFKAGELIGLWATFSDYSVIGLDNEDIKAAADGTFAEQFYLSPSLPTGLMYFSARGKTSKLGGITAFYVQPGKAPATTAGTQLSFTAASAPQETLATISGSGYSAGEVVSLWVTLPDGSVLSFGDVVATKSGGFSIDFIVPALEVGRHYFTAFGNRSGNAAIASLLVEYGNGLNVPGAKLAVSVGETKQRAVIEIAGEGFKAKETVSFWLTLPNGAVQDLGYDRAASDGTIDSFIYLAEDQPVGTYYLSVRGDKSGLSGFFRFTLDPGPNTPGQE